MPRGTKADADLDLLTAVERGEVVTQQTLKHELGVSVGLINALLKRAVKKGLVKVREAPYRRFAYYLTPQGFVEKGRLVADYIEFSLELFRDARDQYAEIFRDIRERRLDSVVLIGGGELTEIAVLASFGEEAVVTAIVDPGANVHPSLRDYRAVLAQLAGPHRRGDHHGSAFAAADLRGSAPQSSDVASLCPPDTTHHGGPRGAAGAVRPLRRRHNVTTSSPLIAA